ncbi:hypothetical protein HYQ46_003367 [Verticillium longisporum]|nr:hypothetical protein HYQ46_003367 [Verticillium longisporum]
MASSSDMMLSAQPFSHHCPSKALTKTATCAHRTIVSCVGSCSSSANSSRDRNSHTKTSNSCHDDIVPAASRRRSRNEVISTIDTVGSVVARRTPESCRDQRAPKYVVRGAR